jgi:two-component system alkaline phosphatase synthesis response regulator PhoP
MRDNEALKILLVDDDEDLLDLLKYNLQKQGFQVRTVASVGKAVQTAYTFQPQLIVLDAILPDGNGFDLCRELRNLSQFRDTLIFFLSAKSEAAWKDRALEIGADDFIEKLGGIRVLTNRVDAVLRQRFIIRKSVPFLSVRDLVIDRTVKTVFLAGEETPLSTPEFDILFFLMQNANHVVSVENVINIIWGSDLFVAKSSVERSVMSLQHKIGHGYIEIVSPRHYRFIGQR